MILVCGCTRYGVMQYHRVTDPTKATIITVDTTSFHILNSGQQFWITVNKCIKLSSAKNKNILFRTLYFIDNGLKMHSYSKYFKFNFFIWVASGGLYSRIWQFILNTCYNQFHSLNVWMFPLGDKGIDTCEGCLIFQWYTQGAIAMIIWGKQRANNILLMSQQAILNYNNDLLTWINLRYLDHKVIRGIWITD